MRYIRKQRLLRTVQKAQHWIRIKNPQITFDTDGNLTGGDPKPELKRLPS